MAASRRKEMADEARGPAESVISALTGEFRRPSSPHLQSRYIFPWGRLRFADEWSRSGIEGIPGVLGAPADRWRTQPCHVNDSHLDCKEWRHSRGQRTEPFLSAMGDISSASGW